jgi:sugar phosphate isomerase/epimerase
MLGSVPDTEPRFSISQISTFQASFLEDLDAYAAAGLDGIGIWELKLPEGGSDAEALEAFKRSGLGAAAAVPAIPSILPLPLLGGPTDPAERTEALAASIHRLAAFGPEGIVCLTGTGLGLDPDRAREIVVEGLASLAREAESAGVRIALEPYQADGGEEWTIASSIADAISLIEDAGGSDALGIQFDVWHLWNSPTVVEDVTREMERIAGVHVCDVRQPTRSWCDRVMPGDGIAGLPAILGTLEDAGWDGFYDLELFSDDGTFGTALPDSLWGEPAAEVAVRGRQALAGAWARRTQNAGAFRSSQFKEGA